MSSDYCSRDFIKILRDFLLCTFILVGIPLIVYYAVAQPRSPTFTLERAVVTGFNLSRNGNLTSFFNLTIRAHNPNIRRKLRYRHILVSIYKDKQDIATIGLGRFTQRKRDVTILKADLIALNVHLKEAPAFDFSIESAMGYLDFDVFMTAWLNDSNLEVNCRHAMVNFTAPVGVVAASPSSSDVYKSGQHFQSVRCSVKVYSDNDD